MCPAPSASFALQAPANPSWPQPVASAPAQARQPWVQRTQPTTLPSDATSFFRTPRWIDGCAFCTQSGHIVHECPIAMEYVSTGRAKIMNNRVNLPNGQWIPNNGSNRGLKHGIESWLVASNPPIPELTASIQPAAPSQHKTTSHLVLSFEAIQVHMAQIADALESKPESDNSDNPASELYDLCEVLAIERKRHEPRQPKAQEAPLPAPSNPAPPPALSASHPATPRQPPQFWYQSSAEDRELTSQLFNWLLEGKLAQATPTHILAASPAIRKDLSEKLRTRCIEVGALSAAEPASFPEPFYTPTPGSRCPSWWSCV
jgi:hypothetical protein